MPTEVIYCNRYNDLITFKLADSSIIMILPLNAIDFVRVGFYENQSLRDNPKSFTMVDPAGGPYIATSANGFGATDMGEFHKDWSGYIVEGIEWIDPGKYKLIVTKHED
jgi:hypothetical protein